MTAREELAVELGIAGGVARGIPRLEIDRTLRHDPALRATYIARNVHLADALLASPALAQVTREREKAAWDKGFRRACLGHGGYTSCATGDHGQQHANPYRDQTDEST